MPDILAAIDGSSSRDWMRARHAGAHRVVVNSNVANFCIDFDPQGGVKRYFPGPNTLGTDVGHIEDQVNGFLKESMAKYPGARICLVGHSRGGLIAILAAKELAKKNVQVHFMGLYDAVDRHAGEGGTTIPRNVTVARHALRHPCVHSRRYFGNTGRRHEEEKNYREARFWATHGGIGGDPEGGVNELSWAEGLGDVAAAGAAAGWYVNPAVPPLERTIREEVRQAFVPKVNLITDQIGGRQADAYIRREALANGLKFRR